MYEYIKGQIAGLTPTYAILDAGGVGYYINISLQTYSKIDGATSTLLYVHFIVREDVQILYGFASKAEREQFRLLLSVSGVGGNTARMILSTYTTNELANIIMTENATLLKNVKGLGLKTSQKIIVELKDKMVSDPSVSASVGGVVGSGGRVYDEAMAALVMLGFGRAASEKVVLAVIKENDAAGVEDVIRLSLKKM